ncbi:hypothetical protein [Lacrimispora sp. 38-1]|uniref:hypothetical protein n=1 Tax=Lacrimispora sp. 38-1 TaxID=3125778 RepID=UPI003CF051F1
MKRRLIICGTVCVLGIAAFLLTLFQRKPVILINSDKIYKEEYSFLSHVFTGSIGEKDDTADDRVAYAKIEQQMLKDYGIIEDISFSTFQEKVKEENARREQAVMAGEKIYGPEKYDARVYYDYIYSEAKQRLIKQILVNQISEELVQDFAKKNDIKIMRESGRQTIRYELAGKLYVAELEKRKQGAVIK